MKNLLAFLLLLVFSGSVNAQSAPIKFGKVPIEDIQMSTYSKDTSAPAVILCDYGHFNAKDVRFYRILRIKILKKEGYDWANRVFPTSSKSMIKGITFNLEDGKVVETKLKNESIFAERVSESNFNMRVAMPNVKVGSVIDLSFAYDGYPTEWRFQEEIPVVWSELVFESSPNFSFQKNMFGYVKIAADSDGRYAASDVPAFKKEPYLNSWTNYISKLEIDLKDVFYPGYYKQYTTSWDAVCKILLDSDYFGGALSGNSYLSDIATEINSKYQTETERIEAAFNRVQKIKWNEKQTLFASLTSVNSILKDESGNSAEINMTLLKLLKRMGFNVEPVVLSTRDNGVLSPAQPSLNKLNHMIVLVNCSNDKKLLLDATEEYMPYDLLPDKVLNWQGRIVREKGSDWVQLKSDKADSKIIAYSLNIEDDLKMSGKMESSRQDYSAYNFRVHYNSFNSKEEFIKDMQTGNTGLSIRESEISNIEDLTKPVIEKYSVVIKDKISEIGDEFYLYPLLYDQFRENPFKTNDRKYPVDFGNKMSESVTVKFVVPEFMEVVEMPKSARMKLEDGSASMQYMTFKSGNEILVKFSYSIDKEIFLTDEYKVIQEFFNQIIKKHSEPIILKRKS